MNKSKKAGGKPSVKIKKVGHKLKDSPLKLIRVGEITHYFRKIKVCVLKVDGVTLFLGDKIIIRGRGTELKQKVSSLQVESLDVKSAKKGQLVGLKLDRSVNEGDILYKIGTR